MRHDRYLKKKLGFISHMIFLFKFIHSLSPTARNTDISLRAETDGESRLRDFFFKTKKKTKKENTTVKKRWTFEINLLTSLSFILFVFLEILKVAVIFSHETFKQVCFWLNIRFFGRADNWVERLIMTGYQPLHISLVIFLLFCMLRLPNDGSVYILY